MTSDKAKKISGLILFTFWIISRTFAGDAVAVGYNKEGVWTSVTYYASSTPKGGKDYKSESEARDEALRDLKKRGGAETARTEILASSDATGFVAIARGQDKSRKDVNVVGRAKSQPDADKNALEQLNTRGATKHQRIVYRYFSCGPD
ncbi:MAG: hypothetical protein DME57_08515 [Verrucomicrobia bacterium]|nr:MAG: hypothetical protein DME57_08515 [Verrucomicrobiota bacterium]